MRCPGASPSTIRSGRARPKLRHRIGKTELAGTKGIYPLIRTCLTTPATQIFHPPPSCVVFASAALPAHGHPNPLWRLRFKLFKPKHSLSSMSLGPSPILLPDLASYSAVTKFATKQFSRTSEIGKFSVSPNVEYWALIKLVDTYQGIVS